MGRKDDRKFENLHRLIELLLDRPQGLTKAEIGRRMNVHRSTAAEYLDSLEGIGAPVYEVSPNRYTINREEYEVAVSVDLHEALALLQAARLLTTRTDKHNPHAASALRKLGRALSGLAPLVSEHILRSADVLDADDRPRDPVFLLALETLTRAWALRRKVRVTHEMDDGQVHAYIFSPYFIEPYALGRTVHVIGHREPPGKLRTFKIERIHTVELLDDRSYEIPADFDPSEQLKDAWGIWYTEGEPELVTLRFDRRVAKRVRETVWHHTQEIEDGEDGSLVWKAWVAEWREMVPWVRGWGSEVEVVGPEGLKRTLLREVKKLAGVYGLGEEIEENDLIAHRRERDGEEQSLITHLDETSQLAEGFAAKVGLPEIGRILGLMHDLGKASKEFQNYLRSAQGLKNPDEDDYIDFKSMKGKIDHSTAGAQLVDQKLAGRGLEGKVLAQYLALALASHHSGLIDCLKPSGENNYERRMTKDDMDTHLSEARRKLPEIEIILDKILTRPIEKHFYQTVFQAMTEASDSKDTRWFKRGLLARFLLSCLLDADRLNTADFENPGNEAIRNYGIYLPWELLIERLEAKFSEFAQSLAEMEHGSRPWEVNRLRAEVAKSCLEFAAKSKGIYQLTVPTGGGKTLSSLRFALHHAQEHKMDRVFYIVPYITIIDQNADEVRKILEKEEGGKVVLEHHSNFLPEADTRHRYYLLTENWDAPIVFTTQVQFLEALFGSGTRDPRRMHQLANSVIILDEVQTIPVKTTHMFTTALQFLTQTCGSTILLCTATQPPFDRLDNPYRELKITQERHIIQNEAELFEKLKRVEVNDARRPGGSRNSEIADLAERALKEKGSVLLVVNTRASAQSMYQEIDARQLGAEISHLSTNMCPAHRVDVLDKIKAKLEAKGPVICVSTQLIEAGVDIDFGAVIRALAGLDSIAQSAGRCNRHGIREGLGSVFVVNLREENLGRLEDIKIASEHAQRVLDDFHDNPEDLGSDRIGLQAIAAYYGYYYASRKDKMDYPVSKNSSIGKDDNLFNLLSMNTSSLSAYMAMHQSAPGILLRQSFRSAASEFRVIDSPTRGVVVPYKDGVEIITDLCSAFALEEQRKLLKKAQRYSINLFSHQFDRLMRTGAIYEVQAGAGIYYLDEQFYSKELGWSNEPVGEMQTLLG